MGLACMGSACRAGAFLIALSAGAMLGAGQAAAVDPLNPSAPCSVFDAAPCTPSFCGVFDPWPCVPSLPSLGQGQQLTLHSRNAHSARAPEGPVNSIRDLFRALRGCWEPPPADESFRGMEMSVRFSLKRTGELLGPPRVTYTSSEASSEVRDRYRRAVDAALERCTPMPFSKEMGGAAAGRPISIRFVDDREER